MKRAKERKMNSDVWVVVAMGFLVGLYLLLSWDTLIWVVRRFYGPSAVKRVSLVYRGSCGDLFVPPVKPKAVFSESVLRVVFGWMIFAGKVVILLLGAFSLRTCLERRIPVVITISRDPW